MSQNSKASLPLSQESAGNLSRRKFLALGSIGLVVASGLGSEARAQSAGFNYYISPTGNDGNPGTLASPWAITSLMSTKQSANNVANFNAMAGKRIGLLPGIYNVSAYMQPQSSNGAVQVPGGSSGSPTYLASSNALGQYSQLAATITAMNGSVYGGTGGSGEAYNGPMLGHTGVNQNSTYPVGYITLDGITFTGFSYKGVRIGGGSSGDGPTGIPGVIVQNCLFTGGGFNPGAAVDNSDALWIDCTANALVTNNKFLNNVGHQAGGADHLNAIIIWGSANNFNTTGTVITNNTIINAGNIYGKEVAIQGTTVAYNYVDMSMYTGGGVNAGAQDFTGANQSGLTRTTNIHHNILLSTNEGIGSSTLSQGYGFTTPANIYNNTIVMNSNGSGTPYPAAWIVSQTANNINFYNNVYTGAADASGYGTFVTNAGAIAIWDYNLLTTGMNWVLRQNGSLGSVQATYTSLAAWKAGVAANGGPNVDGHSVQNNSPGFTNSGTLAQLYQLASGSPALNAGRVGGVPSGAVCNMGAWDGTVTQIGSSIGTIALVTPEPPSNVTVT
jgi:hypothetical protein